MSEREGERLNEIQKNGKKRESEKLREREKNTTPLIKKKILFYIIKFDR